MREPVHPPRDEPAFLGREIRFGYSNPTSKRIYISSIKSPWQATGNLSHEDELFHWGRRQGISAEPLYESLSFE